MKRVRKDELNRFVEETYGLRRDVVGVDDHGFPIEESDEAFRARTIAKMSRSLVGSVASIEHAVDDAIGEVKPMGVSIEMIHRELATRWMVEGVVGKGVWVRLWWAVRTVMMMWKKTR